MRKVEAPWIEEGYRIFAEEGPAGLKVEKLAKQVGKNKSSFYHLFAEMDLFVQSILDLHMVQAKEFARKEKEASDKEGLIRVILDHKVDLLFNRQLRIHRDTKKFEKYFNLVNEISVPAVLPVWKKIIGLHENVQLAEMVLHLSLENFFLQITSETLNETWLNGYFDRIRQMVYHFQLMAKEK